MGLLLLILLLMVSCSPKQEVTQQTSSLDSTYKAVVRLDSVIITMAKADSVYIHDSIYVVQKGDTVTRYVEKTRYQYKYIDAGEKVIEIIHDTCFVTKRDSVINTIKVPVEKPLKWYDNTFMTIGRLFCLAILLWILFYYLFRKR